MIEHFPTEMIDAAAKSMHARHRREGGNNGGPAWDDLDEDARGYYRRCVSEDLAAALAVCKIREDFGAKVYRDDDLPHVEPQIVWRGSRDAAQLVVDTHMGHRATNPNWHGMADLVHHFVFTTPTAPAPPEKD